MRPAAEAQGPFVAASRQCGFATAPATVLAERQPKQAVADPLPALLAILALGNEQRPTREKDNAIEFRY
jgi:hypothetical protein